MNQLTSKRTAHGGASSMNFRRDLLLMNFKGVFSYSKHSGERNEFTFARTFATRRMRVELSMPFRELGEKIVDQESQAFGEFIQFTVDTFVMNDNRS